ncbi:MAG: hypothetical protein ACSHXB_13135 [Sulfitobacter sp.]
MDFVRLDPADTVVTVPCALHAGVVAADIDRKNAKEKGHKVFKTFPLTASGALIRSKAQGWVNMRLCHGKSGR